SSLVEDRGQAFGPDQAAADRGRANGAKGASAPRAGSRARDGGMVGAPARPRGGRCFDRFRHAGQGMPFRGERDRVGWGRAVRLVLAVAAVAAALAAATAGALVVPAA